MVQKSLTTRSKATEPTLGFGDCNTLFDSQMIDLGKKTDDVFLTIFKNRFIENSRMIAYTGGVNGNGCPTDGYLGVFSRNNEVSYIQKDVKSQEDVLENTRGLTSGRACCVKRNSDDNVSAEGEMNKLGLELRDGRFATKISRDASINSGNAVREEPKTCINYSPVPGVDNGVRSEQYCGPKGNEYEYSEECITSDGKTPGIRAIRVGCGVVGKDGLNSCEFSCFNGVDWNNKCRLEDGKKENPNVCLTQTPPPTEPPAQNTFNTNNQTSNQIMAEENVKCSTNLRQMNGSTLGEGYYTCYTVTELNNVTSIDIEGKIIPKPINNTVVRKSDGLPRRVSTVYGQDKNEPCKKLVGNTLTNGVCASTK